MNVHRDFTYYEYGPEEEMSHLDLSEAVGELRWANLHGLQRGRITIYTNDIPAPSWAEYVYDPNESTLGIAWGADADWSSVDDLYSGIDMWLNNREEWALRG